MVGRVFWPAREALSTSRPERVGELLRAAGVTRSGGRAARLLDGRPAASSSSSTPSCATSPTRAFRGATGPWRTCRSPRWIEEMAGERRPEFVELLAHHYAAAQRAAEWGGVEPDRREEIRSRAVELLFDAAEEAARLFAVDRARERLETGLGLARGPIERARGLEANGVSSCGRTTVTPRGRLHARRWTSARRARPPPQTGRRLRACAACFWRSRPVGRA